MEEAHEALEAIDALGDPPTSEQARHLEEELGDLLCQVYFHCRLATEEGLFDLAAVARTLHDKLVARHPHVFGDVLADSAASVVSRWERRKLDEKGRHSLMDGIPASMPSLAVVGKVERRAEGAGLGYEQTVDASLLRPAMDELVALGRTGTGTPPPHLESLLGTLLASLARLGAHLGADPEAATRRAISAFREQFVRAEEAALAVGRRLHDLPHEERNELFRAAAVPGSPISHC